MKIGLIADTHDRLPAIAELVRQMQAGGVGMLLHAGDYCSPRSAQEAALAWFRSVSSHPRQSSALRESAS